MALIIGEKNPKRVESGDIGNLVRASYGKPEVGTAIGEQNDAKNEEEEAAAERKAKLEEIGKLPEEEQVTALLEAGFEEEATELADKLAEKQGSKEDNTDDLPSPEEDENGGEKDQNNAGDTEPDKPKKGGRPKKS